MVSKIVLDLLSFYVTVTAAFKLSDKFVNLIVEMFKTARPCIPAFAPRLKKK
jgi:hypothetical protein